MLPQPVHDINYAATWYHWYRYQYLIPMIPIPIPMIDINDNGTDTLYQCYRWVVAMIPIPINDINDTHTWYQWYPHLISMIPDINDTDAGTWYRWKGYLISMIPIPDIKDTNTDILYQWWCNRYHKDTWYRWSRHLMSMIPIPLHDIEHTDMWYQIYWYRYMVSMNDTDMKRWCTDEMPIARSAKRFFVPIPIYIWYRYIWYRWYRYLYRYRCYTDEMPLARSAKRIWDTKRAKRAAQFFFLDYLRKTPGAKPRTLSHTTSASLPAKPKYFILPLRASWPRPHLKSPMWENERFAWEICHFWPKTLFLTATQTKACLMGLKMLLPASSLQI